jgi:hypothetical protein
MPADLTVLAKNNNGVFPSPLFTKSFTDERRIKSSWLMALATCQSGATVIDPVQMPPRTCARIIIQAVVGELLGEVLDFVSAAAGLALSVASVEVPPARLGLIACPVDGPSAVKRVRLYNPPGFPSGKAAGIKVSAALDAATPGASPGKGFARWRSRPGHSPPDR